MINQFQIYNRRPDDREPCTTVSFPAQLGT
jgi:hypothetical protein